MVDGFAILLNCTLSIHSCVDAVRLIADAWLTVACNGLVRWSQICKALASDNS